ncbi:MAG: DNA-binding protein [Hyphomicrobium sp.]|nr:DNA-binding protein [Hyphomicrobium sp.]
MTAIANDIVVPDVVAGELGHETSRRNGDDSFLQSLIDRGKVNIVSMTDAEYELFADLSSGSQSLDDGEAATIAIAASRSFRAVIDERKGRTRAATLMRGEEPSWTLDLLTQQSVVQILGELQAADAVYLALRHGRMRIPAECGDDIVRLIGRDRALECPCLPNFKNLSQEIGVSGPSQTQAKIHQGEG